MTLRSSCPIRREPRGAFRTTVRGVRRAWRALVPAVLAALLVGISSCAVLRPPAISGGPTAIWRAYRAALPRHSAVGMLASNSLAWRTGTKSARLILDLWGDFDGPLRMDVWSSVGGNLCHFMQDAAGLVAYYPAQSRAYAHSDPVLGARRLGMPFPFALDDLAALLVGRYDRMIPETYTSSEPGPGGGWIFRFDGAAGGARVMALALDDAARPLYLEGELILPEVDGGAVHPAGTGGVWRIAFTHYRTVGSLADADEALPMLPDRLTVTMPGGTMGVLRIKTRRLQAEPWSDSAMRLTLPAGTTVLELDNVPHDWTTGRVCAGEAQPPCGGSGESSPTQAP